MTDRKLLQLQYEINFECYDIARRHGLVMNGVAGPIYDGVPVEADYLEGAPKVLWILQEPHDNNCKPGEAKGNWSVPKDMILIEDYAWGNKTHEPIAKTMYAFRNGLTYEEVDSRYSSDEDFAWKVMEILKSTAWINVSKMPCPSGTRSDLNRIRRAYMNYWRQVVIRQVNDIFKPDIVVVAGTQWEYVSLDLMKSCRALPGYPYKVDRFVGENGRLYLWVDHPTARKSKCYEEWVMALKDCENDLSKRM